MMKHPGGMTQGRRAVAREVVELPEPKKQDNTVASLVHVQKARLERLEHECMAARHAWRASRLQIRHAKQRWRDAAEAATAFWQEARAEFFRMTTSSGQFRKAKAIYERMKSQAADRHLEAKEAVPSARTMRADYFSARSRLREAHRRHEKLGMLRDELRLIDLPRED